MRSTIFREAFDRMVAAREKQVRRYVNGHLLRLDDDALKAIGRTREELLREGAKTIDY
jgi:hypothetical protein